MKILLDESLPHDLRRELPGHEVFTVQFMRWNGIKNGLLLQIAAKNGFDAMITTDSGVYYQQNLQKLPIAVLLVRAESNAIEDIEPFLPDIRNVLNRPLQGKIIHVP